MSLTLNMVGGGGASLMASIAGVSYSSSSDFVTPQAYQVVTVDNTFFSYNETDRTFTCLKAADCHIEFMAKPGYNTSGNLVNMTAQIWKNGASIASYVTTAATGGKSTVDIGVSAGDVISIVSKNNTSSTLSHAVAMAITKAT